jgi:regulator of sigma E protease
MGPTDILLAIFGISVLVIVHESGHYLVARAFKMRVLRYSIGFGPALFRWKPKDSPTTFQVCAIPFLAYVQIAGMNPHEEFDPNDPEIFPNKSLFGRIATIAAGPVANYLAASVLIFIIAVTAWPTGKTVEPMTIGDVTAESPAEVAGLQIDDVIVEANGEPVGNVEDLQRITSPRMGEPTVYVVERDGRRFDVTITPASAPDAEDRGIIGVRAASEYTEVPIGQAAIYAATKPFEITVLVTAGIGEMIKRRTTEGLMGPVGMGKTVARSASRGPTDFLFTLVYLSVALGFFNLLPFPALDGGRLVFLGYELITRRRPNERFEAMVHTVGILFLLGVLVLVTFRDIIS